MLYLMVGKTIVTMTTNANSNTYRHVARTAHQHSGNKALSPLFTIILLEQRPACSEPSRCLTHLSEIVDQSKKSRMLSMWETRSMPTPRYVKISEKGENKNTKMGRLITFLWTFTRIPFFLRPFWFHFFRNMAWGIFFIIRRGDITFTLHKQWYTSAVKEDVVHYLEWTLRGKDRRRSGIRNCFEWSKM